jgi:hypothetical protein
MIVTQNACPFSVSRKNLDNSFLSAPEIGLRKSFVFRRGLPCFMIEGDFDKNKLEIITVCWDDLEIIQSLTYDGEIIDIEEEASERKGEHAWID